MLQGRMPPGPRPSSRAWWWAAWFAVVLVGFNTCSDHRTSQAVGDMLGSGHYSVSLGTAVAALRAAGTDDGDINRYLAYVSAVLGRPYQGYYVRPIEGWKVDARSLHDGDGGRDVNDPRSVAPVVPARPLFPYRDFSVEYPPGFFLFALPPALISADLDAYRVLFSAFMALLLTAALVLCIAVARRLAPGDAPRLLPAAVLCAAALGIIAVRRYDAVVSLSLCGLVLGCVARRPLLAGLFFGLGVAAKGLPILLTPLPLLYFLAQRRFKEAALATAAAVGIGLCIGLPFLRTAGSHLFDLIAYHAGRPLQVESTFGALLTVYRLIDPAAVTISHTYGSANPVAAWDGPLRQLASLLPLVALAAVSLLTWRACQPPSQFEPRDERDCGRALVCGLCAGLAFVMTLGKVLSPQYVTWLLPLGVLASLLDGRVALRRFALAMGLTQLVYPLLYRSGLADALSPTFGAAVLLRNGLLLDWALRLVLRPAPGLEEAEVAEGGAGQRR
jgi:hypothetical protein